MSAGCAADKCRAAARKLPLTPEAAPAVFWDVYGELGHPVRTTVTDIGPVLMARILESTDAQEGALTIAFKIADDWLKAGKNEGLLLDLNDLRALLTYISENADDIGKKYGLVTPQSIAAAAALSTPVLLIPIGTPVLAYVFSQCGVGCRPPLSR